jgi:hypothetical protein
LPPNSAFHISTDGLCGAAPKASQLATPTLLTRNVTMGETRSLHLQIGQEVSSAEVEGTIGAWEAVSDPAGAEF